MILWLTTLALHLGMPVVTPPPVNGCGHDRFEPNDVRRRARSPRGQPASAASCAGDDDWYRVRLEKGVPVEVRVTHHPTARFDRPALFPPRRRKPAGRTVRAPGVVTVRFTPTKSGNHRIRVRSPEPVRAAYVLHVGPAGAQDKSPVTRYEAMTPGNPSASR